MRVVRGFGAGKQRSFYTLHERGVLYWGASSFLRVSLPVLGGVEVEVEEGRGHIAKPTISAQPMLAMDVVTDVTAKSISRLETVFCIYSLALDFVVKSVWHGMNLTFFKWMEASSL